MSLYIDFKKMHDVAIDAWPENELYCLADHAGMLGLLHELKQHGVPYASLFKGSREERAQEVAPLLFAVGNEACKPYSSWLQWLSEHGTYTSSMLLLSSPLPLQELSRRLSQRLNARVSEGMVVLLRYFDPRTFEGLLAVLDEGQRDVFLSVADCWWYLDRRGITVQCRTVFESADPFESPLVLEAEQEFAMLDASEPDQVSSQLLAMMPRHYLRIPLPQRHDFLTRHMAAASEFGIVATHELSLYCGLVLLYGEDFARRAQWRKALERVRSGAVSLSEAVANEEGNTEYAV